MVHYQEKRSQWDILMTKDIILKLEKLNNLKGMNEFHIFFNIIKNLKTIII